MGYSIEFLESLEAAIGRMVERKPRFVVHAEVRDGKTEELDAESFEHAYNIALSWRMHGMTCCATVRRVEVDGTLGPTLITVK